ncbi:MAG: SGNH/GDSL hydrolase family protein [Rubripirellula sp.]
MRSLLLLISVCIPITATGWAPNDGDTVVFLGDSITHQSLYTQYVENFFITRFPERNIAFHNAGVAGDTAANALARFDEDVAAHRPTYVTVLFGMNDGKYEDFNAETFRSYQASMQSLLDRIEAIDAKAIVLSPTMFDHAVTEQRRDDATWRFQKKQHSVHYNSLMAFYGGWCAEEARLRGAEFIDLWAPLNSYTRKGRRGDPKFTLIGDAIHPQASGQVVMAFEILSQMGVDRPATNSIVITKRGSKWTGNRGTVDVVGDKQGVIRFTNTAKAIPWVVPEKHATLPLRWQLPADGRLGYELVKAGHRLSADRFKISGLPPGDYEILIDGNSIGTWNHIALGTKIELQSNPLTPQYQQSLRVAELNRQRHDETIRPARDKWGTIKGLRKRYASDPAKLNVRLSETKEILADLRTQSSKMLTKVREAAKPVARQWTIRRKLP